MHVIGAGPTSAALNPGPHALYRATAGERVPGEVGDGVWLAGDWVGEPGMLADRSLASAAAAADALLARARVAA